MNLTAVLYDKLASDPTLSGLLATYKGLPAIFTVDPVPKDAVLPYIVTAGEVAYTPWDTKTTRGRSVIRDIRCYAEANGSAVVVEAIAEQVRALLHRQPLQINGYHWLISDVIGPIVADEQDAYGRILTLNLTVQE